MLSSGSSQKATRSRRSGPEGPQNTQLGPGQASLESARTEASM